MKKTLALSIMFFALGIASCKKGYLDQSVNPNSPSTAAPSTVLAGALEVNAVNVNTSYSTFAIWLGYYAPSGNYVPSQATETYTFTNASYQTFNGIYNNLANYNYLILKGATDPTLGNYAAIGKIMTAYNYQILVDTYNDVPYTQALNSSLYLFPKYDKGQDIYNDLMVQLDAAIALINASTGAQNPGSSDIIFGGTMASWKKFANTIKLKLAIRQSSAPSLAAGKAALVTELAKTSSEGYLDDTLGAQAQPGYANSDSYGGQQNPYWKQNSFTAAGAEQTGHATNRANTFFINFLTSHGNDTKRLNRIYAVVPASGTVVGNTFGDEAHYVTNALSSPIGPGILVSATMPALILSPAQACFLLAEAVQTGYITSTTTAKAYYNRGITANFIQLGLTAADATAYYTQTGAAAVDVNWDLSPNPISAIQTQKYIALFGFDVFEEYCEYRRTGLPNLSGARSVLSGALGSANQPVPTRIFFPSTEFSSNAAAVAAEPTINVFTSKIFWMP